jgi:predicted Zn-dependent peptidase
MELNIFCKIKALGVGMDHYNKILSTIKGLTAQQIQHIAQHYLDINKMTKVLVG